MTITDGDIMRQFFTMAFTVDRCLRQVATEAMRTWQNQNCVIRRLSRGNLHATILLREFDILSQN